MKGNKHMKTITNIIYTAFAAFALCCFAVLPKAQAVNPAPDGCYPNYTTGEGCDALQQLTTGAGNTGLGWGSLRLDTTGSFNTGLGAGALLLNNGDSNTAVGAVALLLNSSGTANTAVGTNAMVYNETGYNNTATGQAALFSNITGFANTANGWSALFSNTTGILNTALGDQALYSNTTGSFNTAIGWGALASHNATNVGSGANTAVGESALVNHTTGGGNTAVGESVLVNHITGNQNIVLGYAAGQDLTDGNVNIYISNPGAPAEDTTIRIGNVVAWTDIYGFPHPAHTATYIAGISGTAVTGDPVVVDANGQLGTAMSSARFKREIKPMDDSSTAILALKPVTFRYKKHIDPKGVPQFGLVAEEVEKVNPDLVSRDRDGKPYTVRYEAVNAMLLNEFLKAHQKLEEQEHTIAQLKSEMQALIATVKEQASQIQKVSAEVQLQKAPTHAFADNE
jgi:Chaperone of endosialidase